MNKVLKFIGIVLLFLFLIWFVPLFYSGITLSNEGQSCRLNRIHSMKEYRHVITKCGEKIDGGSFVKFEFLDGTRNSFPNWYFRDSINYIEIGDSMVKKKGELRIIIKNDSKRLIFSTNYGCPESLMISE